MEMLEAVAKFAVSGFWQFIGSVMAIYALAVAAWIGIALMKRKRFWS